MLSAEIFTLRTDPSPKNIAEISSAHEQQMFLYLQNTFPNAAIEYESHRFVVTDDQGKQRSTVPDLRIEWTNGKIVFLELTTSFLNGTDPKSRQREVMQCFPDIRYVVLYGQDLSRIQAKKELTLLHAKKIKKNKSSPQP